MANIILSANCHDDINYSPGPETSESTVLCSRRPGNITGLMHSIEKMPHFSINAKVRRL